MSCNILLFISGNVIVTINDVSKEIKPAQQPEYIPRKYCECKFHIALSKV